MARKERSWKWAILVSKPCLKSKILEEKAEFFKQVEKDAKSSLLF